jgi:hypothetical protein
VLNGVLAVIAIQKVYQNNHDMFTGYGRVVDLGQSVTSPYKSIVLRVRHIESLSPLFPPVDLHTVQQEYRVLQSTEYYRDISEYRVLHNTEYYRDISEYTDRREAQYTDRI